MHTLATEAPAALASSPVSPRETAMAHYAAGFTAQGRRALAGVPLAVDAIAAMTGADPETVRAELLAVADGIDAITDEGLTRVQAWYLAGLDQFLGPFPGPYPAVVVPAQRRALWCSNCGASCTDYNAPCPKCGRRRRG
jgi:hypothetical protein